MARTGPKLSPNPGKTARYYRRNKKARLKHRRTNRKINSTPQKRAYRRDLMRVRRKRKPGPQTDMSHKGGKIVAENRKANRRRGATQEKGKKMTARMGPKRPPRKRRIRRLPSRPPGVKGPGPKKRIGSPRPPRPPRGPRPPRPPRHGRPKFPRPGGPRPPRPGFGRPTRPWPPRRPVRPPRRPVRPPRRPVRPPRPPRRRPPIRRGARRRHLRRIFPGRRPPRRHTGIR